VLDSETEAAILKRLQQELAGCSLVYSLPCPRLASAFDRILIMEQGRVVDQEALPSWKNREALAPLIATQ
jgi:ABC-type bacteriocin/lantibiotic exporter with double-glycine peptidase domain